MPYIDYKTEDTWQKRLFDKLISVEDKLDRLLVLQDQSVDTTVHPPLKPEYLDIIDVSKILKVLVMRICWFLLLFCCVNASSYITK